MSTQLQDIGLQVEISTVTTLGRRKKRGRYAVLVDKNDKEAVRAEIIKQALQARKDAGLTVG